MNWISVKDRLPEENEPVLGFSYRIKICIICEDGKWWEYEPPGYSDDEITHWMPLPEPPMEGA